jgi:cation transport protein ChaC
MDLTSELVALCERPVPDPGMDPRLTPITNEDVEELAARLCREKPDGPLWLFAYGSLIWNKPFTAAEQRIALAWGWHRSFCLEMPWWRGTPELPGLMMALDNGGLCRGVAYRLEDADPMELMVRLVRREIDAREDMELTRYITLRTPEGPLRALVFYARPRGVYSVRRLPLPKVAWTLARACGPAGSSASYLHNTVVHLRENGIHDRTLWRLQKLVAAEIRSIHGPSGATGRSHHPINPPSPRHSA